MESQDDSPPQSLPRPPDPSRDHAIMPSISSPPPDEGSIPEELDIFKITPVAALKLLCKSIDTLVKLTGDVPPTPPVISGSKQPQRFLADIVDQDVVQEPRQQKIPHPIAPTSKVIDSIDGVPLTNSAIGSPEAHHSEPLRSMDAEASSTIQQGTLARKFFSKRPPPISTEEYLLRLHRYCPMSTAVYLAASQYINRLGVTERVLPVTPRNVHRLLLASLRVAMKALEDLSYPHTRFARVGGVSETELGRLEISFCFLTDFDLKMDAEKLLNELKSLRGINSSVLERPPAFTPKLPIRKEKRKASTVLPSRPIPVEVSIPT